jgi:ABC-type antimicrobial peptide transport system permease subunit
MPHKKIANIILFCSFAFCWVASLIGIILSNLIVVLVAIGFWGVTLAAVKLLFRLPASPSPPSYFGNRHYDYYNNPSSALYMFRRSPD